MIYHALFVLLPVGLVLGTAFMLYLRQEQSRHSYDRGYGRSDFKRWSQDPREICSICLDEIGTGTGERLPCNHEFHMKCVVELKKRCTICPNCRQEFQRNFSSN